MRGYGSWFFFPAPRTLPNMDYREPLEVAAGDTIQWKRNLPAYPASEGWALKYALRGPAIIDITATADGSEHLVTVASTVNPAWLAGDYMVQGFVEKAAERFTIYSGRLTVTPNLAAIAAGTYDGRSHARRVIAAIEAVIEGRASRDQQEMWVDGERLVRTPFEILMQIRQRYRRELTTENRREAARQGRRSGRLIKFKL